MALKIPLVMYNGMPGQLLSTDTLSASVAAAEVIQQTNDEATSIVIGAPVYNDANDGVKKAKGDATGTKDVIGLVKDVSIANGAAGSIQTNGVISATTAQWDAVFGTTGGLTKGTRYFLSAATSGIGTSTAPSTVGQFVVLLGIALSTTELSLASPFTPIAL
jgi:hypothetical protein